MPLRLVRREAAAALLLILAVLGALWPLAPRQRLEVFDQPFYLGIAHDLLHQGRFTDGYSFAKPVPGGTSRPSGMRFGPLYPALIAAAAILDPALRRNMDCEVAGRGQDRRCGVAAPSMRWLQFAMLAASYWLIWRLARRMGAPSLAWLTLTLALLTAPLLLRSVNYLMTEITAFLLTTAYADALVAAVLVSAMPARARLARFALAGLLLGLATLVRPGLLYLAVATALALLLVRRAAPRPALAFAAGVLLATGPWLLRNAIVMHRPQLSFGYAGHTLAQRVSFDAMTPREYALSFVCWLPDGNGLGRMLAGHDACARFGWDERPDTFYAIGMRQLVPATLKAAGGEANEVHWLLVHAILAHPWWHLATTIPLALRGLYVAHYWGFVLGPICAVMTWRALRRRDVPFLALALPAWFMLGFNAAVAVNQVRYNFMLIPPLAYAGGRMLERFGHRSKTIAGGQHDG